MIGRPFPKDSDFLLSHSEGGMSAGRIVTFYSYTAGIGRTFALANISALLASWGYKVLCVDWDLEAPGLDVYYNEWLSRHDKPGVVELIQTFAAGKEPDWKQHVRTVAFPNAKEPIHFIPAGLQDSSYF